MEDIDSIRVPSGCPQGGCWERLAYLAQLNKEKYVIQIDADTLTRGKLKEVSDSVDQNRSFVLCGDSIQNQVMSMSEVPRTGGTHVQSVVESRLSSIPDASKLSYVRGCAGFSGYAAGTVTLEGMQSWSKRMSELVGEELWKQWGSEQITSNLILANQEGLKVLPISKYSGFFPEKGPDLDALQFIHFIGTNRFRNGTYAQLGQKWIDEQFSFDGSVSG